MTPALGRFLAALGLRRRVALRLLAAPQDPIHGDAARGRAVCRGELRAAGARLPLSGADWALADAPAAFADYVHGFAWLRDLAAAATRAEGAAVAEAALAAWLGAHDQPNEESWQPQRAGARLVFWALYAPYILARPDSELRRRVLGHYARCAEAAERGLRRAPAGLPRIVVAAGIMVAGLMLDGGDRRLARGEKALMATLGAFVLPDGQVATRAPADIVAALEWLQVLRAVYRARDRMWPEPQRGVEGLLRTGLRTAQLGDGRLAALHGGNVLPPARLEALLALPGKALRRPPGAADSGLRRLEAGRTVLVVDAGPPPAPELGSEGHAGALAFELSDGAQRLIVNVGGGGGLGAPLDRRLRGLVRTTAAHSTLVLDDTNQSEVPAEGPLGRGVEAVALSARADERGQWLEASHDGYQRRFGLAHARSLFLAADGRDLRGEDRLESTGGRRLGRRKAWPFAVRFHLMPGIDPAPTADLKGALIRLPGGAAWQMKLAGGELEVDDSLWIDDSGRAERCRQLVIRGEAGVEGAAVHWSFKKMG